MLPAFDLVSRFQTTKNKNGANDFTQKVHRKTDFHFSRKRKGVLRWRFRYRVHSILGVLSVHVFYHWTSPLCSNCLPIKPKTKSLSFSFNSYLPHPFLNPTPVSWNLSLRPQPSKQLRIIFAIFAKNYQKFIKEKNQKLILAFENSIIWMAAPKAPMPKRLRVKVVDWWIHLIWDGKCWWQFCNYTSQASRC